MSRKLFNVGLSAVSIAAVGIIVAIVMELQTEEPVYMLMMKGAAGLFGVGGATMGLAAFLRGK